MDLKAFGFAIFIAAAYVAWPNLAKALNVKSGIVAFLVLVVALVVVAAIARKDIAEVRTISTTALLVVVAFSITNGMAVLFFADKAADTTIQTGVFLVTVYILQMAFAPIADWLVTGTRPSGLQLTGLALGVPVMWLLAQRPQLPH